MKRFSIVFLCLLGMALFSVGSLMLLRFGVPTEALVDPSRELDAEAIRTGASGRTIMITYIFVIAFGAGIFCAGVALLLARLRR